MSERDPDASCPVQNLSLSRNSCRREVRYPMLDSPIVFYSCDQHETALMAKLRNESTRGMGLVYQWNHPPKVGEILVLKGVVHYMVRWIQRLDYRDYRLGLEVVLIG